MKKLVLFFALLFACCDLSAQDALGTPTVVVRQDRQFKIGELRYNDDIRGLRQMMSDIEAENPAFHQELLPTFTDLNDRHVSGNVLATLSGVAGLTMAIGGLTFWADTYRGRSAFPPTSPYYPPPPEYRTPNEGLTAAGLLVLLGGGLIGHAIKPKESRFLNFMNTYNKKRKNGEPLELVLGLHSQQGNDLGLRLSMTF